MLLALMLLVGAQDSDQVDTMLATYRARTAAEIPCKATGERGEIIVCARREADRYRVPLTSIPDRDSVPLRTATLVKDVSRLPCGERAIIAQCGPGFGAGVTMSSDGITHAGGNAQMAERQLAP